MGWGERIKRYLILLAGIFFISFGVALFTKSGTGTSAISVIPYTLYLMLPQLSYGTWVAAFNMLLVVLETILLRRAMPPREIIQQLIFAAVFGYVVDFSMFLLTLFNPEWYPLCLATAVGSCAVLAFGAYLTLISHVGVMAGDGFARALSTVTGKSFGVVRVASDSTMAATAAVMCLVAFQSLVTVREGTVIAALLTGTIVAFYAKHLTRFEYALLPANREQAAAEATASSVPLDNFIVTVARQYGSGGREIGRAIADELGVKCYDAQIISRMAEESGYSESYIASNEQKVESHAREEFYKRYAGAVADQDLPRVEQLFRAEARVIEELAAAGSCVIVGRLANVVLKDHPYSLHLFISGDTDDRVAHVVEREGLDPRRAAEQVAKVDHERAEHCLFITHTRWGDALNYDISMNSSKYGIEGTGELLARMAVAARDAGPRSAVR